jgi:hypothetical protein
MSASRSPNNEKPEFHDMTFRNLRGVPPPLFTINPRKPRLKPLDYGGQQGKRRDWEVR